MLYVFMGQSCTGKSTVANKLKDFIDLKVYAGKDYLRMAKNEDEAWKLFYKKLSDAVLNKEHIIYIITEKEQLHKINTIKGLYKIKFTAPLDIIKSRFAQRMHGNLPKPVEKMIEKQYTEWEDINGDMNVDATKDNNVDEILRLIKSY